MDGSGVVVIAVAIVLGAFLVLRYVGRRSPSRAATPGEITASPTAELAQPVVVVPAPKSSPVSTTSAMTARLGHTPFAIVDVETTGFQPVPDGAHRIVEIAVIRMSPDGRAEDEFITLVNPQRRMGASHVHGIKTRDVEDAPTFAQIAGDVAARISDAIVVAHNAPFDLRFLRGEFAHAGFKMPDVPTLCTLDLAYRFADVSCRKLGFLCEEYGIPIDEHSALGDARAVSKLLMRFLADTTPSGGAGEIRIGGRQLSGTGWCPAPPSGLSVIRGASAEGKRDTVDVLVSKRSTKRAVALAEHRYLEAVELALGDGELSSEESAALTNLALASGISVGDMHMRFVQSLVEGANADGIVTPEELDHISRIARLLGVAEGEVQNMLARAAPVVAPRRLGPGTGICFLGEFEMNLFARLFSAATQANVVVRKNITKTVGAVVVQTEQSEPRRQERAKALGVPVLTAADFLRLVENPTPRA